MLKTYQKIAKNSLMKQSVIWNDNKLKLIGDEPYCHWEFLSERNANNGPLFIPSGLWHGCYNYTNEEAILVYHITNKYDGTDEERMSPDEASWDYLEGIK